MNKIIKKRKEVNYQHRHKGTKGNILFTFIQLHPIQSRKT